MQDLVRRLYEGQKQHTDAAFAAFHKGDFTTMRQHLADLDTLTNRMIDTIRYESERLQDLPTIERAA